MGSTRTDIIDVATPSGSGPFRLELSMGAGTLKLNPGAGVRIVQGTVTYNVDEFQPNVTTSDHMVRIEQGKATVHSITTNIKNDWDLKLGDAPMELKLSVGAARGNLELGGLSLTGLVVEQGASDFTVTFNQPNRTPLERFSYDSGAARSIISGLANLDAKTMEFRGGAGQLKLNFDGSLQRDLQVNISAAAGSVVLTVPRGTAASASVAGMLASTSPSGGWTRSGSGYRLEGSGPTITFNVSMSVGSLQLRSS